MKPNHGLSRAAKLKSVTKCAGVKANVRLVNKIYSQLRKGSPLSSGEITGQLAVDIGDLIYVGRNHQKHVKQLLKMRFPKDGEKFLRLLAQFDVNLLFESQHHLASMKRLLPRLIREAYRSPNGTTLKRK